MQMDEIKKNIKPYAWGVASGAVVLLIVIFAAGWVVTSGSAQAASEEMAAKAVVDRLAPVCVLQYQQDPDREQRLAEFLKTDSWKRDDYVKKIGWATMPGEDAPSDDVASACAIRILALQKKAE